jgi:broad specificity phosphatase PhoE
MKIIFARHGESQVNIQHILSNRSLTHGLTSRGREQAVILADHLNVMSITHIYTSPVLRAVETGAIVDQRLGLGFLAVDALREYDCGILEGRSDEAAWQQWQELYDAWVFNHRYEERIEGGESFSDVRRRFVQFIDELLANYAGTPVEILCISHGGIYTMMLPLVMQNVDHEMITKYDFSYTSCIIAEYKKEGSVCVEWNGHPLGKRIPAS